MSTSTLREAIIEQMRHVNDETGRVYRTVTPWRVDFPLSAPDPASSSEPKAMAECIANAVAGETGFDWQPSVISQWDAYNDPLPTNPTTGDRYIASSTGHGWAAKNIYEWSGTAWVATTPEDGYTLWIRDRKQIYIYDGSAWRAIGSTHTLGSHSDVIITCPVPGQVLQLRCDGMWVNHALYHYELLGIGANDHHNQVHGLVSSDHTVSGLTAGHFLKALTETTFGFAAHGLTYTDVGAAAAGHTHAQLHDAATVGGAPLTISGQQITMNYDTGTLDLTGNNLRVKSGVWDAAGAGTAAVSSHESTYSHALLHAQQHGLVSSDHTVSGLTAGHFLKALTETTYGFAAHGLTYSDVGAASSGHTHAHSATTSLQGGTTGEYYHLTSAAYAALVTGTGGYPNVGDSYHVHQCLTYNTGENARNYVEFSSCPRIGFPQGSHTDAEIMATTAYATIAIKSSVSNSDTGGALLWYDVTNNPAKPKAGIWLYGTAGGSYMKFGTSNDYTAGVTNAAIVIDPAGDIGIGTSPSYFMHAVKSQNASTRFWLENTTAGSSSYCGISCASDAGEMTLIEGSSLRALGYGGFAGTSSRGMGLLYGLNLNGMLIDNGSNTPLYLASNNVVRQTITASGLIGIGASGMDIDTLLHVWAGSAGASVTAYGPGLTVENSDNCYVNILCPASKVGCIAFGSPKGSLEGMINFDQAADTMGLYAGSSAPQLTINPSDGIWNTSYADINFIFRGDTAAVCYLDAGLDQWHYYDNKVLSFGATPPSPIGKIYSDTANLRINGLPPTIGTNINDWYVDNSGYVRVKLS